MTKSRCIVASALACALAVSHLPAQAQTGCAPMTDIIAQISGEKYSERPMFTALLSGSGLPLTVFANPKTGTWTALRLHPDGKGCIIGVGKGFVVAPAEKPGAPS